LPAASFQQKVHRKKILYRFSVSHLISKPVPPPKSIIQPGFTVAQNFSATFCLIILFDSVCSKIAS